MNEAERRALAAIRLEWARTQDDVWREPKQHVAGIHRLPMELVLAGYEDARSSAGGNPIGAVLLGEPGSGKTHLLSAVRQQVQQTGGYFFLISLLDEAAFWRSVLLSVVDGLLRPVEGGGSQLTTLLARLADHVDASRSVRRSVVGSAELTRASLDAFIDLIHKRDAQIALDCQDTIRSLVLTGSTLRSALDVGHTFLAGNDEEDPGERASWGIRRARRSAQELVSDLSRLLALTGPTVMAVDQIDVLVHQARARLGDRGKGTTRETALLEQVAGGLMALRETTRRTLSVVSCLPLSWELVAHESTGSIRQRFRELTKFGVLGDADLGRELVARRFADPYASVGFTPPYPTWPVHPDAFVDAGDFTPRNLLMMVDSHVRMCLRDGVVRELRGLVDGESVAVVPSSENVAPEGDLARLDARFAALLEQADPGPAVELSTEDEVVPRLLAAGLAAWVAERGVTASYTVDPLPGPKPALHARLVRRGIGGDDDAHWAFRAICATHAVAALNRIRNAVTVSGLTEGVAHRSLFLLRSDEWPNGTRTAEVVAAFEQAGGVTLDFTAEDISVLSALAALREEEEATFAAWCVRRRPAHDVNLLRSALSSLDEDDESGGEEGTGGALPPRPTVADAGGGGSGGGFDGATVSLGVDDAGHPVTVALAELRKHVAVFAGSGSGKTVFLRRLVEECALQGVSAIVLDLNNDLARMGDPWPHAPSTWGAGDDEKAKRYHHETEVVVWTPGLDSGRPLSFRPLPDFGGVLGDADEFRMAVDAAVAALLPRAGVAARAARAQLWQAVLREALTHYARTGAGDLRGFIALLNDLPDGVSLLNNAQRMATDMAQALTAAMVIDQLFGGAEESADPSMLLTPADGKAARISIISFAGLPTLEQQQSFINQLQLALFSWIKRNPARDKPLRGLLVMDEAQNIAPARGVTSCTRSTLALTSQARKYGLGLVFATQAPKGLHNGIPGNSATQLFGLLSSPAHISAVREIARAKGGDVPLIARLKTGQFYAAVAGGGLRGIRVPMCLSHHPHGPLTIEEVVERARLAR